MMDFKFNGDWNTVLSLDKLTLLQNDKFFKYSKGTKQRLVQGLVDLNIFDGFDNSPDPTQDQLTAIKFIQQNEELILIRIYEWVNDIVYPVMRTLIDDEEWVFPKLEYPEQIEKALGLVSIDIFPQSKDSVSYFSINFQSSWDNEHGFHILFHKDRIIDSGEAFGVDTKKICEDCGMNYEQLINIFNHWDDNIFDFIPPNPKYGKLKPNQLSANERLPYRLIRNGQEEKLYNYVNAGLIDIDYGVHGHSLFATALQAENIGVINFLIDKKVKNLNNVMYALSQVKNGDIKRVSEEYFLKNNG